MPSAGSSARSDRPHRADPAGAAALDQGLRSGAPRFHCPLALESGVVLDLPDRAARHAQVLRLQPGAAITLFGATHTGRAGGEFAATVVAMGRQSVQVQVGAHAPMERESARALHLAIGMPANERMDWLVEKATELGVATIAPLMTERTVVRLDAQRAAKRLEHWQGIAIGACEQCGRNRVPVIHLPLPLGRWFSLQAVQEVDSDVQADADAVGAAAAGATERAGVGAATGEDRAAGTSAGAAARLVLSLQPHGMELRKWLAGPHCGAGAVTFLCGPEGGLSPAEEAAAVALGFCAVSLGPRVLRAETAALAALTLLG